MWIHMRKRWTVARERLRRYARIRFVGSMGLLSIADKKRNVMGSVSRLKDKGASAIRIAGASLIEGIVGLTYPPRCLGCSERLFDARAILCLPCFHSIDRASAADVVARLARLPEADSVLDSVACLWIFDKGGAIQVVHQALKYGNRPSYGVTLGEPVGAIYMDECHEAEEVDLIVPIPLHRSRLHERGYNQAEMLALGVSTVVDAPVYSDVLIRPRPTKTQTALKRSSRWENLEGAFRVADPGSVAGRHVLLVDDVLTTGSTAGAAAKVLLGAGARRVDLATLAMART
jgi:ComF family protein